MVVDSWSWIEDVHRCRVVKKKKMLQARSKTAKLLRSVIHNEFNEYSIPLYIKLRRELIIKGGGGCIYDPLIYKYSCQRFGPRGPSTEPTSEFIAACPCPDVLARDRTQGGMYYLAPGVLVVGVTSIARERACLFARPRATPPRRKALDLPFIDARRGSICTNGGVDMC
jgi:hypothetical protein